MPSGCGVDALRVLSRKLVEYLDLPSDQSVAFDMCCRAARRCPAAAIAIIVCRFSLNSGSAVSTSGVYLTKGVDMCATLRIVGARRGSSISASVVALP